MARIWKETGFVENDPYVIESEEVKAGEGQIAVLDLEAFLAAADETNEGGLAVLIKPADDATALKPYIDRLALVAVAFPAFNDGRAFSHASLLRSRLGYQGELRAVGDVLIDQVPLMLRCGIDSFAVTNETALKRLSEKRLPAIREYYQPAATAATNPGSYGWRRLAKAAV
ncbi:DUF934 domain-containing protein [Rhizobiaceae bacterium n13]|uniref:DUF934 domain-containing protein n=1 Tax=Ferirhizobium litorale TaxID=2927786 RepID=A0AAE3U2U1_9HYPH|nr:DUF934 domain-containing protein [Fererhizobium litorale]MDI7863228.1 DUF934 domain-containing protein [Fererhizobium litorale]MDI7923037.1 DUF934 domain-containing protein [Fererhizobium litorale]